MEKRMETTVWGSGSYGGYTRKMDKKMETPLSGLGSHRGYTRIMENGNYYAM